jgi:membrane-associated phospholipid phosphatase
MRPTVAFRLRAFVRRPRTPLLYLVYWVPFIACYQLVNRFPMLEPRELPLSWVDRALPFVPALLPLYVAYLPLYWATVARSENDREASRIFYGAHVQLLLSLPFFVLLPTRMPLEQFYGPEPYNWADALWRWFDAPNNCFPSLHTSNALLLLHFNWRRSHRWAWAAASIGVVASTVLVKQHYVADVAGGALVYFASRWFLARLEITGVSDEGWSLARMDSSITRARSAVH